MKNKFFCLAILFLLFIHLTNQVIAQIEPIEPFKVIEIPNGNVLKNAKLSESTFLQQDEKIVSQIIKERPATLFLKIPINKENSTELNLERFDMVNQNANIVHGTSSGDLKVFDSNQLVTYRGHVAGNLEAIAVLSFTQQSTGGFITTSSENFVIETLNGQENLQMIYKENEVNNVQPIPPCGLEDTEIPDPIKKLMTGLNLKSISTPQSTDIFEVKVAIEADYEFYRLFQENLDNALFNLLNTMAVVSQIYEEDMNIRLVVSYIRVWTTPDDPYTERLTGSLLGQFQKYWNENMSNINRNLAFYVTSHEGLSGSALGELGGIKNLTTAYGIAVGGTFAIGRTLDASYVKVFAHEIGHILGSPHTHSCYWPSGPIDFCANIEGDCYTGPVIKTVGTIMSYCTPTKLQFHPLCRELIRSCVKASPNIKIIDSKTLVPILVSPINGDNSVITSPILNWIFVAGADQYRIQIATNDNFTNLVVNTKTEITKYTISGLKDKTTFYWRVSSENEFGEGNWSDTWQFTTSDGMIQAPPVSCFPREGDVAVKDPIKFIWYSATGATSYQIQVGHKDVYNRTFSSDILDISVTDTTYTSGSFETGGSPYWWRIRAFNGSQYSIWTEPSIFWRVLPPHPQFPYNNMYMPTKLPLIWSYFGAVTSSQLQVSEKDDFSNLLIDTSGILPPTAAGFYQSRIYMASLGINKTYYWRVRHNFLDADSMIISSEWSNSQFNTGKGLDNVWRYYNSSNISIKLNSITDIGIGNNDEIWFCIKEQGIAMFNGNTWTFYDYESTNGLLTNSLGGLYVNRVDNVIWVGGNSQGHPSLFKFHENKWTVFDSNNAGLPASGEWKVQASACDASGMMWFATSRGLIKYDGSYWTIFNSANSPLPSNNLESLCCESNGIIWIGTADSGLVKFDGSNWTIFNSQNSSLPGNRVGDIQIDSSNNLWVACDKGLIKISGTEWEKFNLNNLDFSYYMGQLALDKSGNMWIGGGNGIAKYDGKSFKYYHPSGSPNAVYGTNALEIDDAGKIWIGGNSEGIVSFNSVYSAPISHAGADQTINEGVRVSLDGSLSSDPDGNTLTYKWTAPAGIALSSTTIANPTFTAPAVTQNTSYTFLLIVNDGTLDSPIDQVVVTVKNVNKAPVANAGLDQSVNEEATVFLDGSLSSDADGNPLTYKWTAPAGITLSSTTVAKPTFKAPEVKKDSTLNFSLVVNDGLISSWLASVKVTVLNVIKVGVSAIESPLLKIYPNPTTGIVNLEISGGINRKGEVVVTNLAGAEVFRKEITDATKLQIDLSNQVNGIYILKGTIGAFNFKCKVLIRK